MKWIYLAIGIFSVFMSVMVFFIIEPENRARGLRICVTAAVVNIGLYLSIDWAQRRR